MLNTVPPSYSSEDGVSYSSEDGVSYSSEDGVSWSGGHSEVHGIKKHKPRHSHFNTYTHSIRNSGTLTDRNNNNNNKLRPTILERGNRSDEDVRMRSL